jgi:RNA polymerase sigma-70 factor (ECF subfamily)
MCRSPSRSRWRHPPERLSGPSYAAGIPGADEELVAAAQRGGRPELDALLRAHYDRMYAVCRRLTGNDADAADATQEALVAVVKGLPRFDGRSRFSTWTYRIAVNASLDELRRRRRRPEPGLFEDRGDPDTDPGRGRVAPLGTGAIVGQDVETAAARLDVDAALRQLSPEFRAAVVLRDLCGLDYAEIAEVLGLPAGTVRSRIARGRAALVPLLTGNRAEGAERPRAQP